MSKFDAIVKKIEEATTGQQWDPQTGLPLNQAATDQWNKMPEAERKKREQGADKYHNQLLSQQPQQPAQVPQTQQQNLQAVQQAAKLLNIDPKALEQLLKAQQKPAAGVPPTNQPAV